MFKAVISTSTAITANSNIPVTVVKNTNDDVVYDAVNKVIKFNNPGTYKTEFHIVTTNVAVGDITVSEVINGVTSDVSLAAGTSAATTDYITLDVPDILSVYPSTPSNIATLSYQSDIAATIDAGVWIITRIGR